MVFSLHSTHATKKKYLFVEYFTQFAAAVFSVRPYNRFVFLRPSGGVYETRLFSILLKAFY